MGGAGFDRGVFMSREERYRKPPGAPIAGLVIVVSLAVAAVVGGYMYIRVVGLPDFSSPKPDLSEITARLEQIEQRLEKLEARRIASISAAPSKAARSEVSSSNSPSSVPTTSGNSSPSSPRPVSASAGSPNPADEKRLKELQGKYESLRGDVTATREAWDAATNHLVGTTTELGEHRGAIAENRERLGAVERHFDRTPVSFEMKRGGDKERVGPVWLWLLRADQKRHRYTMRVFVDDKWIELKDRALLEPVEFYISDVAIPLELVVTDIQDDRVAGTLAVPPGLYPR